MSGARAARPRGHLWIAAAEVTLTDGQLGRAVRGKLVVRADVVLAVVEVYCRRCRRTWTPSRAEETVCLLGAQHVGGPRVREEDVARPGTPVGV